jgi:hypothetical protein
MNEVGVLEACRGLKKEKKLYMHITKENKKPMSYW